MPLEELRRLAFEDGPIREHILSGTDESVTGHALKFDDVFLARMRMLLVEGRAPDALFEGTNGDASRRMRDRAAIIAASRALPEDSQLQSLLGWKERCDDRGYPSGASPVLILEDVSTYGEIDVTADGERGRYPLIRRAAEAAIAQIAPGDWIGTGAAGSGTVGGILRNGQGDFFAMTCAHAVPTPSPKRVQMGVVWADELSSPPGRCNQHANPGAGLDVALISLSPAFQPQGTASASCGALADIDQGDLIVSIGHRSGTVLGEVAEATVWKKVKVAGQVHCMADLFAIGHRNYRYLTGAPSKGGDSGAWVYDDCPPGRERIWRGMIIAGSDQLCLSYASHARYLLDWARLVGGRMDLYP